MPAIKEKVPNTEERRLKKERNALEGAMESHKEKNL